MPRLHLLGTGAALSGPGRTTTMLALEAPGSVLVVDCGGDVVHRLLAAGLDLDDIEALLLTHEHPDHVSGFPLFMEKIWLAQRRRPIPICGPERALDQARRIFDAFRTDGWEGLPERDWRPADLEADVAVWSSETWTVTGAPAEHSVPALAFRFEHRPSGVVVAYSGDTERSDRIRRLAEGADVLVHEASGGFSGHTSIPDAARIARDASVGRLLLVHLPPEPEPAEVEAARKIFPATDLGEDGAVIELRRGGGR